MSQLHNGYLGLGFTYHQDLSPDLDGVIFSAAADDIFHRYPMRCGKAMESARKNVAGPRENHGWILFHVGQISPRCTFIILQSNRGRILNVIAVSDYPPGSIINIMKFGLQKAHILPFRRATVEYFPVPSPWILPQFGDRPYDSRTQRIKMDVFHDIKKILGFVYDRGFVSVLE